MTGNGGRGLGGLGGLFGGGATGGLAGGLGDLLRQFEQKGHGETANSWVQTGENKSSSPKFWGRKCSPTSRTERGFPEMRFSRV